MLRTIGVVLVSLWLSYAILWAQLFCAIVKPFFPRKLYSKWTTFIQSGYLCVFTYMYERNSNLSVRITGDYIPDGESALVLPNHLGHDWAPIYSLAIRKHSLGGFKCIMKKSIRYVPGFGTAMWLMQFPLLSRKWVQDKAYLESKLKGYKLDEANIWMLLFMEGTRFTGEKHREALTFAKERQLTPYKHTLQPRIKGFAAMRRGLKGITTHVYDVTLGYTGWDFKSGAKDNPGPVPTDIYFPTNANCAMHVHVKRYELASLPEDDEGLKIWAQKSFEAKNDLLEQLSKDGQFPGESQTAPLNMSVVYPPLILYIFLTILPIVYIFLL